MLKPLYRVHHALRRHHRAVPWRVTYSFGHGAGAGSRELVMLAPTGAVEAVLWRIHNGALLLQPASIRLRAPVDAPALEPTLGTLRSLHALPIIVNDESDPPWDGALDLPAMELPERPRPKPGTLAVGVDIGGTGLKVCAARGGEILRTAQGLTWPEGEHGVESLIQRTRALVQEVAAGEPVGSLGVGFASPMGLGGEVVSLSTVMRQKLGGVESLDDFPQRIAAGITAGPLSFFNDLANLGLLLSGRGARRRLRVQIGTSFGGCWIDADGTVNPAEVGRMVVDAAPDARPHTYLPLHGAMKTYLSNLGVAQSLSEQLGRSVTPQEAGFVWADLNRAGAPEGRAVMEWLVELLRGVVEEARVFLPGLRGVELGGSMLQGATGRDLRAALGSPDWAVPVRISPEPGYDGALAAALAPLVNTPLRGMKRLSAPGGATG